MKDYPKNRDNNFAKIDETIYLNYVLQLEMIPIQYEMLGIDLKAKSFKGENLLKIEISYKHLREFTKEVRDHHGSYNWVEAEKLKELISKTLSSIHNE